MNISLLNDSINMSFDINFNNAIDSLAENAGNIVASGVRFVLKRSLTDTKKVLGEVNKGIDFITQKVTKDCKSVHHSTKTLHSSSITVLETQYKASKIFALQVIDDSAKTRDELLTATKIRFTRASKKHLITPIQEKWSPIRLNILNFLWTIEGAICKYKNVNPVSFNFSPETSNGETLYLPHPKMTTTGGSNEN